MNLGDKSLHILERYPMKIRTMTSVSWETSLKGASRLSGGGLGKGLLASNSQFRPMETSD